MRVDIVVGVAVLDGALAIFDRLVVVLQLVVDLRQRAQRARGRSALSR